jgi:hypothetical protein
MAITVGNTASSGALAGGTSNTLSLNNNKTDVIVGVALRDTRTAAALTSATYGGDAMTVDATLLYTDGDTTEDLRVYILRKSNALTGVNNIVITMDSAVEFWCVVGICADGLASSGQPNITGGASHDHNDMLDPSTTITTTVNDCLLFDCLYSKTGITMTADTGQTIVDQVLENAGSDRAIIAYKIVSALGVQTSTYGGSDHDDWDMISVAYKINQGNWPLLNMKNKLSYSMGVGTGMGVGS